ncbi:uncharacterized protein LOC119745381 isoform X2 [Patiria miniata]|uniref:THAP-type domain-containing protein n=1 Tax=Patiria miniata TaxID=46514 RepID=A0A914BNU2_PATMI|nr:uncharacterized protein LOC119745381 isoform X2 [Patiria miniata]
MHAVKLPTFCHRSLTKFAHKMPAFCVVYGCGAQSKRRGGARDNGLKFFRIPKVKVHVGSKARELSEKRRRLWISAIGRADKKDFNTHARVCSRHFASGKSAKDWDTTSIDWVPTLCLCHSNVKQADRPTAELKQPDRPTAELKQPDRPTAELKQPDRRTAELKQPDRPTAGLKQPDRPTAELNQPDRLTAELKQPDRPTAELKQPDRLTAELKTSLEKKRHLYYCCVPQCTNSSQHNPEQKLSFHKFPDDENLRKVWAARIHRIIGPNFQIKYETKVCSAHFKPGEFVRVFGTKRKLKKGAVPSIFKWTAGIKERPHSLNRRPSVLNGTLRFEDAGTSVARYKSLNAQVMHHSLQAMHHSLQTLRHKLEDAHQTIHHLEDALGKQQIERFGIGSISADPQLVMFYTGFTDYQTFQAVYMSIEPTCEKMIGWGKVIQLEGDRQENFFCSEDLTLLNQFFLFLCRVKVGLLQQDLAVRFHVSRATVNRVLIHWTKYLHFVLGSLAIWPSRNVVGQSMPECVKTIHPKMRVILDCSEVKVQNPRPNFSAQHSEPYPSDRCHTTFKGLVGVTPSGAVSFVSHLHSSGLSDKELTEQSGILKLLEKGDQVMFDTGFPIGDMLQEIGCTLVFLPYPRQETSGFVPEVTSRPNVERLRTHVEHVIRRVKEFHIFDGVIPFSLACSINQLWTVCCLLTNFKRPLC